MRLKMNTGICPIVCVGMYESFLDPRYVFEGWESRYELEKLSKDEQDYCTEAECDHFNVKEYKKIVARHAIEAIEEFFKDLKQWEGIEISLHDDTYSIWSPQYYNYETDQLKFEISIDEANMKKVVKHISKDMNRFFEWIKERYRSRSGFISSMPYERDRFFPALAGRDVERALAMFLMYVAGEYSGYQCSFEEKISSNYSISEFVDDDGFQKLMMKILEAA